MLGVGDVDYMDYNISYYTTGYESQRLWLRGLYAYPAIPGKTDTTAPDLATAMPVVSDGGLKYTITLRSGVNWNTKPATPVTAADAVLGLKRACNPVVSFGGLTDFLTLIKGYSQFCAGFAKAAPTLAGIKTYIDSHSISGATASGQTLTYTLTQPASYFPDMLTLPPFNPAPRDSLKYIPSKSPQGQNTIANGPYTIQSYVPAKKIVFVRNPAWSAATDPIRKAYVDKIVATETGNQPTIQQILQTNSAAGSMEWDTFPPVAAEPGLIQQMLHGNKDMNFGPTFSSNPYVVFNTASPNNGGALAKTAVRQAISYAIDRAHLIQDMNGATISPPLTHVLPDGINGAQDVPKGYDPYPYSLAKAKAALAAAGYKNGLTLTFLYRPVSSVSTKIFQTMQADLALAGIRIKGLGVPQADFYTKYLQVQSVTKKGVWDVSLAGWGPDWFGDAATSYFKPLFYGPPSYPTAGSNFGLYNNPAVTALITKAASQASQSAAATLWGQADQAVMKDAPIFPITQNLQGNYHASYVHNAVYISSFQNFDASNVWLSKPGS